MICPDRPTLNSALFFLIYASSAATYGSSNNFKVGFEEPNNVYGFSKLMMDNIARQYMKNTKISIVGLRYFNVYGAREYFKNTTASMILQFGLQLLSGKNPRLFEKSDQIKRDFIYIEDVVQANIKAMQPQKSGIYNVGTAHARSFQDIVDILQNELQTNFTCEYIPNPYLGSYQFFTEAKIEETQQFLSYTPLFSLEKGIAKYINEIKRIYQMELQK